MAKRASDADGRSVVLSLTPRGKKRWAGVMDLIGRRNAQIFACLTAAERKELSRMLDRLIGHARS